MRKKRRTGVKNIKRKDTTLHNGIRIIHHDLWGDIREIPLGYSQVCS